MTDPERLDALETTLTRLALQLSDARRELAALRTAGSPAPAAAPVAPATGASASTASSPLPPRRPPPAARPAAPNFEKLAGRYGALALAMLTIVMGAGALVSWAIDHGLITPWVRVALGALLAVALAVTGWRLRSRSNRAFGDALLALALAVTHVVAWAAGPGLGLVPSPAAMALADAASFALMWLALRENHESLFNCGFGGALIAPFVTSDGSRHYTALAAYGLIVLAGGIRAIGGRAWRGATVILSGGVVLYAIALLAGSSGATLTTRELAPFFAGVIAAFALFWEGKPGRPAVTLTALALAAVVLHRPHVAGVTPFDFYAATPDVVLMAAAVTVLAWIVARALGDDLPFKLWGGVAILVPLVCLTAAPISGSTAWQHAIGIAVLAWAVGFLAAARFEAGVRRGALLTAGGLTSAIALVISLGDLAPQAIAPALAAHAVLFAVVSRRSGQPLVLIAVVAALALGYGAGLTHFNDRAGFNAVPFGTIPSLEIACIVVAAYAAARAGLTDGFKFDDVSLTPTRVAWLVAGTLAFCWGRIEMGRAISADASNFLILAYYATTSMLIIWGGRRIGERWLRVIGLVLALWAGVSALGRATNVDNIALRVGSYLGVGAYLLGVAWWYRADERKGD